MFIFAILLPNPRTLSFSTVAALGIPHRTLWRYTNVVLLLLLLLLFSTVAALVTAF